MIVAMLSHFFLAKYIKTKPELIEQLMNVAKLGSLYSDEEILCHMLNIDFEEFLDDVHENWEEYCK